MYDKYSCFLFTLTRQRLFTVCMFEVVQTFLSWMCPLRSTAPLSHCWFPTQSFCYLSLSLQNLPLSLSSLPPSVHSRESAVGALIPLYTGHCVAPHIQHTPLVKEVKITFVASELWHKAPLRNTCVAPELTPRQHTRWPHGKLRCQSWDALFDDINTHGRFYLPVYRK